MVLPLLPVISHLHHSARTTIPSTLSLLASSTAQPLRKQRQTNGPRRNRPRTAGPRPRQRGGLAGPLSACCVGGRKSGKPQPAGHAGALVTGRVHRSTGTPDQMQRRTFFSSDQS